MKYISLKKKNLYFYLSLPLLLILSILISHRNPSLPDYVMYLGIFNNINYRTGIEYSYILIVDLIHLINGDITEVMLIYAFIGIMLKSFVIFKYSSKDGSVFYYYSFLVMYFLSFLVLWEYIQIRAGAGISIFLLGAFIKDSKKKIIIFLLACSFHYSMILPCALYLCFYYIKNIKYQLICIPIVLSSAIFFFYLTPFARSYSAGNYLISGKGIFSTQYCLVYLNIIISLFFKKRIVIFRRENIILLLSGVTITIMMVVFNKGFPAFTDRLMDIAAFISIIPLFFVRNSGYKTFLFLYVIFFGLMRFRVITSGLDPNVMNFGSFLGL